MSETCDVLFLVSLSVVDHQVVWISNLEG